jgi:hypothetical protein
VLAYDGLDGVRFWRHGGGVDVSEKNEVRKDKDENGLKQRAKGASNK